MQRELVNVFSKPKMESLKLFSPGRRCRNMVVLFGTLGFHPEKLLSAIPGLEVPVGHVVIYSAAQAKTKERELARVALKQVTETLDAMGMSYEHREFTSPWSFSDIFRVLLRDLQ